MFKAMARVTMAVAFTCATAAGASDWSLQDRWGGSGDGPGELRDPRALAVGPNHHVYVADYGHSRIQQYDAEGNFVRSWGALGEDAAFGFLKSVEVGPQGNVYVLDGSHIEMFSAEGAYLERTSPEEHLHGYDLAIAADGTIFTAGSGLLYAYNEDLARVGRIEDVVGCTDDSYGGATVVGQQIHLSDAYCQSIDVYTAAGDLLEKWPLSNLPSSFSLAASNDRFFLTSPTQRAIRVLMSGGVDSGESIAIPEIDGSVPIPTAVTTHEDLVYVLAGDHVLKFAPTTAVDESSWSGMKSRYR